MFSLTMLLYNLSVMKETAMFLTAGIVISAFGELFTLELLTVIIPIVVELTSCSLDFTVICSVNT